MRCGRRLQPLHLFEHGSTCEQVRLRDPYTVEMREVGRRLRTKMKVKIAHRRVPLHALVSTAEMTEHRQAMLQVTVA